MQVKAIQTPKSNNLKQKREGANTSPATKKLEQREYPKIFTASKPKIDQVKYVKIFNVLADGIAEMIDLSEDICNLTREVSDFIPGSVDDAMDMMMNIFANHMPSFDNKKNLHFDISMSANKCSLKTDKFMSFGWYIKNNRLEDNSFTYEYILHITVFGDKEELPKTLLNSGWIVDTYKK